MRCEPNQQFWSQRLTSHSIRLILAAAVALAGAVDANAVPDARFEAARTVFLKASGGDSASVEPAAQSFLELLQTEPANPVLMAYAGAAQTMRATTTWLPWKKLAHAEDGLAQIDKALLLLQPVHAQPLQMGVPAVLDVKLVAANTFLAVPAFMNRRDKGLKLLGEVANSPLLEQSPAEFRKAVANATQRAGLEPKGAK